MKTKMSKKISSLERTNWRSLATMNDVREQIRQRWGDKLARKYDPTRNCRSYNSWKSFGFFVRKNERALTSIVYLPVEKNGEVKDVIRKRISLFYYPQLQRIIN
jgi:hypothetical protein